MSADTATVPVTTVSQCDGARVLTKEDRCDRCGAAAVIEVCSGKSGLSLLFCQHHANKHADALAEWIVTGASEVRD